jgi:hypothetical protein
LCKHVPAGGHEGVKNSPTEAAVCAENKYGFVRIGLHVDFLNEVDALLMV